MSKSNPKLRVGIRCYPLLVLLIAGGMLFWSNRAESQAGLLDGAAFAVPVSNRVIHAELVLREGFRTDVTVREGTMARVQEEGGHTYGLVPVIQDSGHVEFAVYELTRLGENERAVEVGRVVASEGAPAVLPTAMPLDVLVSGVSQGDFTIPAPENPNSMNAGQLRNAYAAADTCCLTCNGSTTCACSVSNACGTCCSGECCVGGSTSNPRFQPVP